MLMSVFKGILRTLDSDKIASIMSGSAVPFAGCCVPFFYRFILDVIILCTITITPRFC